jgi:oxygen-independent coproporphyrinogen-3 oxidase
MKSKQQIEKMDTGGHISLNHLYLPETFGYPLIITHGTLSNAKVVRGLGRYLAQMGFDCWLLEWGGHGNSEAASKRQNFEYPGFHDVPTAIEAVLRYTQKPKLYWISHSGGGHLLLMYLARHSAKQSKIAGFVTIGTQSTDATLKLNQKIKACYYWGMTMLRGETPIDMLSAGNEGEPTCLLAQWFEWNIRQRWVGTDGFDYLSALSKLTIPSMILAGGNDIIAPASGCLKFFNSLGSNDKTWLLFAESTGFSQNFTHEQLVIGREAHSEVFPHVGDWLVQRNS